MASPATSSTSSSAAVSPMQRSPPAPPVARVSSDRLYGQGELSTICEGVINALFAVNHSTAHTGLLTPPPSPPSKASVPPALIEFIAYALYRTRLPPAIVYQALLLLERLKQRYPSARGTASSPHRLFLAALMLSSKMAMDDTYSNKSWAIVGGNCFALREVNQMERELFAFLGCNVHVGADEVLAFQHRLETRGASASASAPPSPVSAASASLAVGPPACASMPPTPPLSPVERTSSSLRATVKRRRAPSSEEMNRARRAADAAVALLGPLGDSRAASRMPPPFEHRSGWSSSSASSGASTPTTPPYPPQAHPGHNVGMGIMAPRPSLAWPAVRPNGKMAPPPSSAFAQWPPAAGPAPSFAYPHGGGWA